MTKFHLISFVLLTLVSSIFAIPQQQGDNLQPRVELLETTVAKLSARVEALEALSTNNTGSSKTTSSNSDSEKTEIDYEVASIDAKITESNSVFVKYAWILTIKNNGKQRLLFNANIEFLDADGFIVDQDFAYRLLIEPYETQKYTGAKLVNTSIAGKVTQITAKTNVVSFEDVVADTTYTPVKTPTDKLLDKDVVSTPATNFTRRAVIVQEKYGVNARKTPNSESESAEVLSQHTQLVIIDEQSNTEGNWYQVQVESGETAWIASQYVDNLEEAVHLVDTGDTVASIANKYHTTEQVIILLNSINEPSLLYVGQHLRVPIVKKLGDEASTPTPKKVLEPIGDTTFTIDKFEISIDSCEYQSTSDDKTFDRYLCVEQWKNKSSKGVVLKITIHLFDSDGVELTTSGTISSYASDSGSTSTIKVLIDYPQAEQVAKYSVTVEEQ